MSDNRADEGRRSGIRWAGLAAIAIPVVSSLAQLVLWLMDRETPAWLSPFESLGVTLLALLGGLWLLSRSVRDTRARADAFHVGEALAVGYGLNFLQPAGHRLLPDAPADQLLGLSSPAGAAPPPRIRRVRQLLVALPGVVDQLDTGSIDRLRQTLGERLGSGWWIGQARLNTWGQPAVPAGQDTLADKPSGQTETPGGSVTGRGVGVTAVVHRDSGAVVLIDLPSTLTVVPQFAEFVAGQELADSPWSSDLVAAARSNVIRRFEAAKFARVLEAGLTPEPNKADGDKPLPDTPAADGAAAPIPSAEALLRQRLGPVHDRLTLVPMASTTDIGPLLEAVRRAAQTIAPEAR